MYIAFLQSIRFPLGDLPSSLAQKENPADGSQHFSLGKARIGRAWKSDLGSRIPGLTVCAGIVSHLPVRAADAGHVHGPFCCWASACKPSSFCSSRRAQPEAMHGRAENLCKLSSLPLLETSLGFSQGDGLLGSLGSSLPSLCHIHWVSACSLWLLCLATSCSDELSGRWTPSLSPS